MPLVTVNPNDVTGTALPASSALRIGFQISEPALGNIYAFVTKPVYAYPDPVTNIAGINLVSLENLSPADVYYKVWIEYLDSAGGYIAWDGFDAKLYLGSDDGELGDLLELRSRPSQWWVSTVAAVPPGAQVGDWLLVTTTSDVFRIR